MNAGTKLRLAWCPTPGLYDVATYGNGEHGERSAMLQVNADRLICREIAQHHEETACALAFAFATARLNPWEVVETLI